jgi:hypothetical protein
MTNQITYFTKFVQRMCKTLTITHAFKSKMYFDAGIVKLPNGTTRHTYKRDEITTEFVKTVGSHIFRDI